MYCYERPSRLKRKLTLAAANHRPIEKKKIVIYKSKIKPKKEPQNFMVEGKCTGGRNRRKISSLKEGEKHKTELNEKLEKYMQEGSFVMGRSDVFEWRRRKEEMEDM